MKVQRKNKSNEIHYAAITCKPILTHDISKESWRLLKWQLDYKKDRTPIFLLYTLSLFKGFTITGVKIFFYMFLDCKTWANQVRNPARAHRDFTCWACGFNQNKWLDQMSHLHELLFFSFWRKSSACCGKRCTEHSNTAVIDLLSLKCFFRVWDKTRVWDLFKKSSILTFHLIASHYACMCAIVY